MDDLNGLPDILRRLRPTTAALNRDALMYGAGLASAPRLWPWRLATAVAVVFACAFAVAFLAVANRAPVVAVPQSSFPRSPAAAAQDDVPADGVPGVPQVDEAGPSLPSSPWLGSAAPDGQRQKLRDHLLQWGLDGLGAPPTPPARRSLDELLRTTEREP
jgi:hypothetical protein